jgi:hypothetical protein
MDDEGFTMLQARPLHLQAPQVPDRHRCLTTSGCSIHG